MMGYLLHGSVYRIPISVYVDNTHKDGNHEPTIVEVFILIHFFYNYYVFQYATGFSAAVAIANRILKEGAPAVADYKKFLSGGCSTDPISLLKIAGVDMSSPEPVNSALALFGELVDELAELL